MHVTEGKTWLETFVSLSFHHVIFVNLNFLSIYCYSTCNSPSTTTLSLPLNSWRSSHPFSLYVIQSPHSNVQRLSYPFFSDNSKSTATSSSTKNKKRKNKIMKLSNSAPSPPPPKEKESVCHNESEEDEGPKKSWKK